MLEIGEGRDRGRGREGRRGRAGDEVVGKDEWPRGGKRRETWMN